MTTTTTRISASEAVDAKRIGVRSAHAGHCTCQAQARAIAIDYYAGEDFPERLIAAFAARVWHEASEYIELTSDRGNCVHCNCLTNYSSTRCASCGQENCHPRVQANRMAAYAAILSPAETGEDA